MADIANLQIGIDSSKAERATKRVERDLNRLENKSKKTKRTLAGTFDGMIAGATKMRTLLAGAVAFMGLRQGIRTIAGFEQTMAGVRAVTRDITQKDFKELNKVAREMGATTQFSAQQAAEGMSFLGMAGFNTNQIISALPGTLNLAAAGSIDLATSADIASNVLQAFGLKTGEMGRVADVMAKAVSTSNQNMYELAEAINYAAPTLSALGIELEDVAAGASVLANQGIKASMAGTAMRMMFVKLLDPTKESLDILKKYNLNIDMLNPRMNKLVDVFERLKALSPEELIQVFGARGIAGASAITRNMDQMVEYMKEYRNATGAAEQMASIRLDTLAGDWELLKSAVVEFTLQVGDSGATGAMRGFVQAATSGVQNLNSNWGILGDGMKMLWNGFKAIVYDIHGGINYLWDGLKLGIIKFLDWMLEKVGNAFRDLAANMPDVTGMRGARGQLTKGWIGMTKMRAALQDNMDNNRSNYLGDFGEWQFNRADALWAENQGIVNRRLGAELGNALQGGPQRAATNDEMDAARRRAEAAMEDARQQAQMVEITAKRPAAAFIYGWEVATKEFGTLGERIVQISASMADSMDQHMTDGIMDMIEGTKSVGEAFKSMATSIIRDLIRVAIQQLIVRQLLQGLGGFSGAFATTSAPAYHSGGVAGFGGDARLVGAGTFAGARRYEGGGIAGDEVPAILHRGEVVLNDEQMAAMQGNRSGNKVEVINVADPRMVDERIAKNPQAIINVIGQNARAVRRALNL